MPPPQVRGHLHYTADKPLFGRVTGRIWWNAYERGNPEHGVIHKSYVISEPRQ